MPFTPCISWAARGVERRTAGVRCNHCLILRCRAEKSGSVRAADRIMFLAFLSCRSKQLGTSLHPSVCCCNAGLEGGHVQPAAGVRAAGHAAARGGRALAAHPHRCAQLPCMLFTSNMCLHVCAE